MNEKLVKLIIEYDGTNFYGWQRQSKLRSVQGEIERVLKKIFRKNIEIDGAGRTDAGVHAYGQVASFKNEIPMPIENLKRVLNNNLAKDVRILDIAFLDDSFHARYSAIGKTYIYKVINTEEQDVFLANYTYHYPFEVNYDRMVKASKFLIGKHDFRSFMAAGSKTINTVRTISDITITKESDMIIISFTGDGFLYKMIRILTGLLLEIGNNRIDMSVINEIIDNPSRKFTTKVAPSNGLYLNEVFY